MTIYYCDWATGDDTSGTGTYLLPWKTITKATTSRSAGDEIRVGKSPEAKCHIYQIEWENRNLYIESENRIFAIDEEQRNYSILFEDRIYKVSF